MVPHLSPFGCRLTRSVAEIDPTVGDAALSLASTVVQVLRFPHRFQLILFMLAPLLLALSLAWALGALTPVGTATATSSCRPSDPKGARMRSRAAVTRSCR